MADESGNADGSGQKGGERPAQSGWVEPEKNEQSSESGAEGGESYQKNLARPSAEDIYKQVALNAKIELKRSTGALAISGFAGGIFMGLSGLGVALTLGSIHI